MAGVAQQDTWHFFFEKKPVASKLLAIQHKISSQVNNENINYLGLLKKGGM